MKLSEIKSNKIQMLRGLAIIAVVFIHNTPNGLAQVWLRPFMNFAVGLFLFLSGMLSNAEKWNPKKRIMKVVVPYIIWTLIYVVLFNIKTPTSIPFSFLKGLISGNSAAIMYYIFVYCEFTLLMPLVDVLAKSKYKYLGFAIAPIEIIFMRLIPMIMGYNMNQMISDIMSISCLGWFTYYYFGYLLGNNIIQIKISTRLLGSLWLCSIVLQIIEGYWYFSMGVTNCGTQIKLSSILSGSLFAMLAFRFINSEKKSYIRILHILGDCSFGIYFSHIAIMFVLSKIPYYGQFIVFPLNAVIAILASFIFVIIGKKVLGKYSKYLAL